jgi:RNA polymerase sigma factor (sigma-70 family)
MPDSDPLEGVADWQLLRRYAEGGSQAAFADLVRRYVDFVYSMALRRTWGDCHLAEDVTQAVFVLLARKAGTVGRSVILPGWLHRATRYVAANALKRESRRRRHERAAGTTAPKEAQMSVPPAGRPDDSADWESVAPLLETALDHLGATDRDAVLLRFIRGKSHRDVGEAMGISEDAARKRVERALTRLRNFFAARGVWIPALTMATLLATRAVEAAPPALATTASAVAVGGGAAGVSLAEGAAVMMAWTKAKLVAACVAATMLVSTAAALTVKQALKLPARPIAQAPAPSLPGRPVVAQQAPPVPQVKSQIEGTVFGIDGEPLPGAEVFLCTPSRPLSAATPDRGRNPPVVTEGDGRFSFPPTNDALELIAVFHPDGYAQVDARELAKSPRIFIRPWARIEGVLLDGDKPLAGETVIVGALVTSDNPFGNCIVHQRILKTDKDGRFAVDRIAPIGVHLYRNSNHRPPLQSKWDYQLLEPGKTAKVQLGGIGRHALGRLLPPAGPVPGVKGPWIWQDDKTRVATEIRVRYASAKRMTYPPGAEKLSPQERMELEKAWKKTPEGIESQKYLFGEEYAVAPDGTFRLEDLRPGKYTLEATITQDELGRNLWESIASGQIGFEVPAVPEGRRIGEPVNIGDIKMRASARLVLGEPAPDFAARSLDGGPVTLADFKGKFLLVHFPPSRMQAQAWDPFLKAYQAFSGDPQFAMLTVHVQPGVDAAALKAEAERQGVKWPQALVESAIAPSGTPSINNAYRRGSGVCLIDPQGRVAGKLLPPKTLEAEVAKILLELR